MSVGPAPPLRPGAAGTAPPALIATGAILVASLVGVALAADVPTGLALLIGACYMPVLALAPTFAVVLFVPLVFLEGLAAFNLGGKAAGALIGASWIGASLGRRVDMTALAARHRRALDVLAVLLLWMSLSLAWAEDSGAGLDDLWRWYAVALLFLIVSTMVVSPNALKLLLAAFVVGAVLSVIIGLAGGLVDTGSALQSAAEPDARLEGATGDPNFLAAGLVAAMVIAAGLMVAVPSFIARWALGVAIAVCSAGMVASESRGGFVALLAVVFAAFLVFRRRRVYVTVAVLVLVGMATVFFSITPGALDRITSIDNGGSGRSDLWTVAWRITKDHPGAGVGINNFESVAGDYTRRPGKLTSVRNIAEDPHVVHNTYLQLLAENGIPGLALFLLFAGACCRAAWLAGNRFEASGKPDLEALARTVLVATIGMLTASVFISGAVDKRLWILFALGPATLALAGRGAPVSGGPGST